MKINLLFYFFLFYSFTLLSQEEENKQFSFEANYFYGNIVEHNTDISHLIIGHPEGVFLSFNKKTFGLKEWEKQYNFPDWGFSFIYQNMKNPVLGENFGVYAHYNFYLLKRNMVLSIGTGLNYNTNPYDQDTNFYNNAYGSRILSTTYLRANYVKDNLWKGLGFQAGLMFIHYSNANIKAPNTSTNSLTFNIGANYQLDYKSNTEYNTVRNGLDYTEKIKFNFVFRSGFNESDVVGSGVFPFYVFSAYADKRLNYKSTLQAGADFFVSKFLEEQIRYRAIAFPEDGITGNEDYKRVGVFVGHELRIHQNGFVSQIGYYVYWPYEFENRVYLRLGIKRYFLKDKLFAAVTLKSHWAKAEAVEFGIGYRL